MRKSLLQFWNGISWNKTDGFTTLFPLLYENQSVDFSGTILIKTDKMEIDLQELMSRQEGDAICYDTPIGMIELYVYQKNGAAIYREICIHCAEDFVLEKISFTINFQSIPLEMLEYRSFLNVSTAVLVRYNGFGFFTGIENPFFRSILQNEKVILSYEPSLILKKGDKYQSEPQFIGAYQTSGVTFKERAPLNIEGLEDGNYRPRFFNPCGMMTLDRNEATAIRKYVAEYYDVTRKVFRNIFYYFFYPQQTFPASREEVKEYFSLIDRFKALSGDMIVFNPHVKTTIPDAERPYWELAPEHSVAKDILMYAQDQGIACGYYMGCAFNGEGGNAANLPFRPDHPEWKKRNAVGESWEENCLGCDDYADWWYQVQKNTIERYRLGYWSWDPGPGNGRHCYAANHGHLPGKGEYKAWRNSQKLLKKMKEEMPDVYLMSFYGRKEYGIWGLRYFDQHEVYWEQTLMFGASIHPQISDDRMNADGTRLQNIWSMNFRFLPASIGHGLVTRMGESWMDSKLNEAVDRRGYEYALLSAIACAGSVTLCNLPSDLSKVPGMGAFYRKWIAWARKYQHTCDDAVPLTDGVSVGQIDGIARIKENEGHLFLFNPMPQTMHKRIRMDSSIGISNDDAFALKILYPKEVEGRTYQKQFSKGDDLDIVIPAYTAVVLELTKSFDLPCVQKIPHSLHSIGCFVTENGEQFLYPKHSFYENITLKTTAFFSEKLQEVLQKSKLPDQDELEKQIEIWRQSDIPFTFVSALPDQLTLYIPFASAIQPKEIELFVNKKKVPVTKYCINKKTVSFFASIQDFVEWGRKNEICVSIQNLQEDSFMGFYVDYPNVENGMEAETVILEEYASVPELYYNPQLKIRSFHVTPQDLNVRGEKFKVAVSTDVPKEQIKAIYFMHPTRPQMPALKYDADKQMWYGEYESEDRRFMIFDHTLVSARIYAKDGGVGPKATLEIGVSV